MAKIQIQLLKNQAVLADQCEVADSYLSRLIGLMGRTEFAAGTGLYFPRCSSVHMWFMRMPIDIVFVRPAPETSAKEVPTASGTCVPTRVFEVTSVHTGARPWRALPFFDSNAKDCFELPSGTATRYGVETGDRLCIA